MSYFQDIKAFHEKFDLAYTGKPRMLASELADFRIKFLSEELAEYTRHATLMENALCNLSFDFNKRSLPDHLEGMFDALVDLVYVAIGTAYLQGFNFDEGWKRVHEANMRKQRAKDAGESKRGSSFDVIKPPGWVPPSHKDLVQDHAHQE